MISQLKSRLPRKKTRDLDAFIFGAEEKTEPKKEVVKRKSTYPWESIGVREDVKKTYNLRLSEPYLRKLKYIAENTPDSMKNFCMGVLEQEIDNKINQLTK